MLPEGALAALELEVAVSVLPGAVFADPDMAVDELLLPVVAPPVDGTAPPVPLLDVLPSGVVELVPPALGVVAVEVLLESRVVVTSSRREQAVREASAIRVTAPAWAIFKAVMAVPSEGC